VTGRYDTEIQDRRKWDRFRIRLRCLLHAGAVRDIPAIAENISRRGLLVRCESAAFWETPGAGQRLRVFLPISSDAGSSCRVLECLGVVVWGQYPAAGDAVLGLTISKLQFRNAPSGVLARGLWKRGSDLVM
jgi:hypothetical protein